MHARTATIDADPSRIDDGIRVVNDELMPALLRLDGCVGLSMVCDRASGRCIVTTSWQSEPAMRATSGTVADRIGQIARAIGDGDIRVEEWEIAVMHRSYLPGDGSCARITWARADPAVLATALDNLPLTLLPRIDDAEGFCSLSLFVDRGSGRCAATAVYENRHAMAATRDQVVPLREQMAEHMGLEVTEVAEFELPIHHLRVPEVL